MNVMHIPDDRERIAPGTLCDLAAACLRNAGANRANAAVAAEMLVRADLDGIASHGVARVPLYVDHLRRGRVDGRAEPRVTRIAAGVTKVDACFGLAAPAVLTAVPPLQASAVETGIGIAMIGRAHLSGVLGHYLELLAAKGLTAVGYANSPAAIAAPGGKSPRFGTNPIAFAFPRPGSAPLVIDLSMGAMNRGSVMLAASQGRELPEGRAFDAAGKPTTDPAAALQGTIAAIGGHKGAALALAVDLLAGGLTGSLFSSESRSGFERHDGPRYCNGVVLLALHPETGGASHLPSRVEELCTALQSEDGVRLPGARRISSRVRLASEGIAVPRPLLGTIRRLAVGRDNDQPVPS